VMISFSGIFRGWCVKFVLSFFESWRIIYCYLDVSSLESRRHLSIPRNSSRWQNVNFCSGRFWDILAQEYSELAKSREKYRDGIWFFREPERTHKIWNLQIQNMDFFQVIISLLTSEIYLT
jgi:hypothetical protein